MREELTSSRYANAVLMKLSVSKKKYVFLVEGKTDRILFSKFAINKNVLINSCDGKPKVYEVIKELRLREFNSFIAILDSDFERIDNEILNDNQIFYSDHHDIELSIIESNSLNVILEKYCTEEKLSSFKGKFKKDYKDYIFELGSKIGYLKWSNKKDNLGLVFKPVNPEGNQLKLEKFIDKNLNYLGNDQMINQVIEYSKNRKTSICPKKEIEASFTKNIKVDQDLLQLCNGHDLCYLIALSFRKIVGNVNVSHKEIENDLRLSYDSNCFKKTNLYTSVKAWEKQNEPVLI